MELASIKPSWPTWLGPASTLGICAGGPLNRPPVKIGTFVLAGCYVACQHKYHLCWRPLLWPPAQSLTKISLTMSSPDRASLWTVPERSSGTAPKSPNTRGKVLFLNFLEEVTLKGKFVPYLAYFSSLIHSLELKLCCLWRRASMVFFLILEVIELEVNLFPIFLE